MGLKHLLQRSALAICLASACGALGDNTGWYFSRANCLTANESITWRIDATPTAIEAALGQVLPGTGFSGLGIPAFRKTTSIHRHRHESRRDHSHQSSVNLVWTWRSHAGSFPAPEAEPYVSVQVRWHVLWDWDWDWSFSKPIRLVPYLVVVVDPAPWYVSGTHHERTSANVATVTRTSFATGCNWDDTFNSMGG